jgi:hypothetical protein
MIRKFNYKPRGGGGELIIFQTSFLSLARPIFSIPESIPSRMKNSDRFNARYFFIDIEIWFPIKTDGWGVNSPSGWIRSQLMFFDTFIR